MPAVLMHDMDAPLHNSFNEQFLRKQREVFAYIVTLVPDRNDAEDIFQETCLQLFQKAAEFDCAKSFFPWACGFALNEVRRFRRAHYREKCQFDDGVFEALAELQIRSAETIDARLGLLMDCMARLPVEKKELLLHCYSCGESLNALAVEFKIDPPTLRKRLERIRKTLFECIETGSEPSPKTLEGLRGH
jgi:RNA polymerase sigma-70 factor (ECF subfamily)